MLKEIRSVSKTGGQKGVKLARFDLIPQGPLVELAEHFGIGASKYTDHQWRAGYEWSKSYSAMMRHLAEFWAGRDYDVCSNDPDGCQHVDSEGRPFQAVREDACYNHTGGHHMVAVMWHSAVLLEFKDRFPEFDDRYKFEGGLDEELNRSGLSHALKYRYKQALSEVTIDRITVDEAGVSVDGELVCTCIVAATGSEFGENLPLISDHLALYHSIRK